VLSIVLSFDTRFREKTQKNAVLQLPLRLPDCGHNIRKLSDHALRKTAGNARYSAMRSYSVQPVHTSLLIIGFLLSSFRQIYYKYTLKNT
jgi:hypothetical protein